MNVTPNSQFHDYRWFKRYDSNQHMTLINILITNRNNMDLNIGENDSTHSRVKTVGREMSRVISLHAKGSFMLSSGKDIAHYIKYCFT